MLRVICCQNKTFGTIDQDTGNVDRIWGDAHIPACRLYLIERRKVLVITE